MRIRIRRNRANEAIRSLVRETQLSPSDLIVPLFVADDSKAKIPIASMPGQFCLGVDLLLEEAGELSRLGIKGIALFPRVSEELKDSHATYSYQRDSFYLTAIKQLKESLPGLLVISDVAMDPYSCDGHDGLVDKETGRILNDESLEILGQMALVQAQTGADLIGPSDMMDGRIGYLRDLLDSEGFKDTGIISYSAKYASSYYGPFRDALDSAPKVGDKKTYQMDPANVREALREVALDEQEGADIVMVKPGLPCLDVIRAVREVTSLPLAVYNTSGEYAMIMAAAERGWLDGDACAMEALVAFKRAGADMVLSYFGKRAGQLLNS